MGWGSSRVKKGVIVAVIVVVGFGVGGLAAGMQSDTPRPAPDRVDIQSPVESIGEPISPRWTQEGLHDDDSLPPTPDPGDILPPVEPIVEQPIPPRWVDGEIDPPELKIGDRSRPGALPPGVQPDGSRRYEDIPDLVPIGIDGVVVGYVHAVDLYGPPTLSWDGSVVSVPMEGFSDLPIFDIPIVDEYGKPIGRFVDGLPVLDEK